MKFTFRDLYNLIQVLDRNGYGFSNPIKSDTYQLHIYDSKNQVNVNKISPNDVQGLSVANIVFDDFMDTVSVYKVTQGYCDYDHPMEFKMDDNLVVPNIGAMGYITSVLKEVML